MQTTHPPVEMGTLVRRHWFKLVLIALGIYLFLQKDFSFQLNMHAPDPAAPAREAAPVAPAAKVPAPVVRKAPPARMTQAAPATIKVTPPPAPVPPARMEIGVPGRGAAPQGSYGSRATQILRAVGDDQQLQLLERFAKVAISEQQKYGVPASITLASALLHSHGGTRDMAAAGNNYFALACEANTSDYGTYQGDCYRHFTNAWSSFRAHSEYITSGRFVDMRNLAATDYKAWAIGLERIGYGREPELASALVGIIERFRLQELDRG